MRISRIPKDGVLGALPFVVYRNDRPEKVASEVFLFANNTAIFKKVDSINYSSGIQNYINMSMVKSS